MYKPNFCAECGERVARARWHLWTSRRFCTQCVPRFRSRWLLLPLVAGAALFSLGLGAGRAVWPATPPLIIERGDVASSTATRTMQPQAPPSNTTTASAPVPSKPEPAAVDAATLRPTDSSETVAICGAMTKKGTPCQRRVRGTGRCWQHKGMPAVVPLEQRLIAGR